MSMVSPSLERVTNRTDALGISRATLATVCGLKPATLSNMLRGIKNDGEAEYKLATTSLLLVELADAVSPLLLPNDPVNLSRLLNHVRERGVTADAIRGAITSVFGSKDTNE